jgi:2-polyprenyl-6-methoxyphenol hydroxylase-like FAD-dependent oxidoreductase
MTTRPQALIIGGSVGGLMAASLLRGTGWDVTVFERAVGDLAGRGAGIGISEELMQVMRRIGARIEPSMGVVHDSHVWMDAKGRIVFEHRRPTAGSAWSRVYRPLRDLVPPEIYRQGMMLERVEEDADSVTAIFADRSRATGDLLVAADGVFSTVRRQFLPEIEPRYAGYVAWRGVAEERDLPRETRDAIFGRIVFCFPEGELLLAMSVPGEGADMHPGDHRFYVIWYRPVAEAALRDLFTDASGRYHGASIPPPLIRSDFVNEVRAQAEELLPPQIATVVRQAPQLLLQAITDLESPRMTFGRVALMGDAAFIARPHVAGGVSKAALNAQCLADSFVGAKGDRGAALAYYDRTQHEFGSRIGAHSRYLGAYLEGQTKPLNERRGDELHRDPRRIMQDYGAPNLLHAFTPST